MSPQFYHLKVRRGQTWLYVTEDNQTTPNVAAAKRFDTLAGVRYEQSAWLVRPDVDGAEVEIKTR